jgi:carboxyl-terminal processing protease
MLRAAFLLLLAACGSSRTAVPIRAIDDWRVSTQSADSTAYSGKGRGSPSRPDGAALELRTVRVPPAGSWSSVVGLMDAHAFRGHTVMVTAEVRAQDVSEDAVLWLAADGPSGVVAFQNTQDRALKGTTGWTPLTISMRLDPRGVRLRYGVVLSGTGLIEARRFRVTSQPAPGGPPSAAARELVDFALVTAKDRSYWRDTVTWSAVEPDVWMLAGGARSTDDAYPAIRHLLSRLGDHHSFVKPPAEVTALQTGGPSAPANPSPEIKLLAGGIGYVAVPAFSGVDRETGRRYAADMHARLAATIPRARCGWVVDLRANGGGNMWPMLAGLKPLLGSGPLGSFKGPSGAAGGTWLAGAGVGAEPPPELNTMGSAYVAVLTGSRTASSGEAVAIAFRGRPNTRSFGQPTAGVANANIAVAMPDGGLMMVMTEIDVDRNGREYGQQVDPDELIPRGSGTDDAALTAAVHWLQHSAGTCQQAAR